MRNGSLNIDHHGENCLVLLSDISFLAPSTVQKYKVHSGLQDDLALLTSYILSYAIHIYIHINMISEPVAWLGASNDEPTNDVSVWCSIIVDNRFRSSCDPLVNNSAASGVLGTHIYRTRVYVLVKR